MHGLINLQEFERQKKLLIKGHYKYIEVMEKKKGKVFFAKISCLSIDQYTRERIKCLSKQINVMMKLNHPAIIKFYGFSPINFKNKAKPVILYEKTSEFFLDILINTSKSRKTIEEFNNTAKLKIIYGIASGMAYLHSHNIIHCNLQSSKINVDKDFNPKITGFSNSKDLSKNFKKFSKYKGDMAYIAPEVLTKLEYSKASDVYSFAMIVYEIITFLKPFENEINNQDFIQKVVNDGLRPNFKDFNDKCYLDLINKCWSQNPKDRPTFLDIVSELRTNFITSQINKDEFENYIKLIDDYPTTFDDSVQTQHIDDVIKSHWKSSNENKFQQITYLKSYQQFLDEEDELDIITDIKEKKLYYLDKMEKKELDIKIAVKVYKFEISELLRNEVINLCNDINNMIQLNHPSILSLIEYIPTGIYDNPTIIYEF